MLCRYVSDQLLNKHRFSYSGAAKQSDLSPFCIRSKKIDYFDSRFQDLNNRALVFKCRRISVNHPLICICDLFAVIYRLSKYVKQSSQRLLSDRNFNPRSCCSYFHVFVKPFACSQHQTANFIVSEMLRHFHNTFLSVIFNFQSVFDKRKVPVLKHNVYNRTHNLYDFSFIHDLSHFLRTIAAFCRLFDILIFPRYQPRLFSAAFLFSLCPCPAAHFCNFLCDRRLPCSVIYDRQVMVYPLSL